MIPRYVPEQPEKPEKPTGISAWIRSACSSPVALMNRNHGWLKVWAVEAEEQCGIEFVIAELRGALERAEARKGQG